MKTWIRVALLLALAGAALLGWRLLAAATAEGVAPALPGPHRPGVAAAAAPAGMLELRDPGAESARAAPAAAAGKVELRVELRRDCIALESPALRLWPVGADQPLLASGLVWRVPHGSYDLQVDGSAWRSSRTRVELHEGSGEQVIALRPEPLARFTGRVLDRATLVGIPRFQVQVETLRERLPLESTRFHREVELEGDGSFCLEGLQLDPEIRFHVRAPGYEGWTSPWSPFEAAPWRDGLVFLLDRSADVLVELRGRVFGETGPLPDAEVLWLDAEAGAPRLAVLGGSLDIPDVDPRALARTDADGAFVLRAAAPRTVHLVAYHPEHVLAQEGPFELVRGQPLVVDLALERGAAVSGRVRMLDEHAARQRPSSVYLQGPSPVLAVGLDGELRYRAAGLAPGGYVLVLHGLEDLPGGGDTLVPIASRSLALEGLEEAVVDFDLLEEAGGGAVSGLARLPEGASAWPCYVGLCGASLDAGPVRSSLVAQDGRFSLGPVQDGEYLVVFAGQGEGWSRACAGLAPVVLHGGRSVDLGAVDLAAPRVRLRRAGAGRQLTGTRVHLAVHEVDQRFAQLLERELLPALDAEGTCEVSGLPPGRYFARLEGSSRSAEFRIEPGFAGTLEIALP